MTNTSVWTDCHRLAITLHPLLALHQGQHLRQPDPCCHEATIHIPVTGHVGSSYSHVSDGIHRCVRPVSPICGLLDRTGEVYLCRRHHHSHLRLLGCKYPCGLGRRHSASIHRLESPAPQEVEAAIIRNPGSGCTVRSPAVRTGTRSYILTDAANRASIATIIRMPYIPSYAAKSDKLCKRSHADQSCLTTTLTFYRQDWLHHPLDRRRAQPRNPSRLSSLPTQILQESVERPKHRGAREHVRIRSCHDRGWK